MKKILVLVLMLMTTMSLHVHAQASLNFDGTNDYLSKGAVVSTATADFTIEAWVKWDGSGGGRQSIIYNGSTGSSGYGLYLVGGQIEALLGGVAFVDGVSLTPGEWTHLALARNSTTLTLYKNGVLIATSTAAPFSLNNPNVPNENFTIGANNLGGEVFKGSIDEVRFWTIERSQAQIQSNMNAVLSAQTNLLAYYNFNNGTPNADNTAITTIPDVSANGNTLTLNNFALTGGASNFVQNVVKIYYVNAAATTGTSVGTNWANAYTSLQTGINAAAPGDEVWVAAGTYYAINASFSMKEGVKIYGGFAGTETGFSQRNLANKATLKGNGNTVISNVGNHLTAAAVLDGFIITGGYTMNYGGGMHNYSSSPTIANCIFSDNATTTAGIGGGMMNEYSSPAITNCIFSGNAAPIGGGMMNEYSSPVITNCTFSGNKATSGGGIYNAASSNPIITNTIIWGNAASYGNGLYDDRSSSLVTYSDVQGGVLKGTGNISGDPLFTAPGTSTAPFTGGNYTLQNNSSCINAGTPDTTGLHIGNTDLAGNARIAGGVIDMGAYEAISSTANTSHPTAPASLNFDGVNDYVQIPNSISTTQAFTIEYWMKTTQTGHSGDQWYQGNGLADAEMSGAANDFGTSLNGTKVAFGIGNTDKTIFSTSDVNTGSWVHVAAVWDGTAGTMNLYIDGISEASATSDVPTANRNAPYSITLGAINSGGNYYNGNIDELHFWNVARTQQQIRSDMHGVTVPAAGLVASYSFNDGVPEADNTGVTTIADSSGNGNRGTMFNFALQGTASNFADEYQYNTSGLPVMLMGFEASLQNGMAQLQWQSGVESNFNHFEIEKSAVISTEGGNPGEGDSSLRWNDANVDDGFAAIANISAKGSNSHYVCNTPQPEPIAYYRLKMVDNDGVSTYSNIVTLSQNSSSSITVYPNPAADYINIKVANAGGISIYSASGGLVKMQILQTGINKIDISALKAGIYFADVKGVKIKFIKL